MASILGLSAEITEMVLRNLPPRDLLSLRQTCTELCARIAPRFARHYFQTRYVMLERRSLDTLVEISKHRTLGPAITTLEICVYHFLPLEELPRIKPPYSEFEEMIQTISPSQYEELMASEHGDTEFRARTSFLRSSSPNHHNDNNHHLGQLRREAYLTHLADQDQVVGTDYAIECLKQAMGNLHHCKNVIIDDDNRAWGLRSLKQSIGVFPQRTLTSASTRSIHLIRYILCAVLTALAASKLEIADLDISIGCSMENGNRISPYMLPTLLPSPITSLRQLHIVLDPTVTNVDSRLPWGSGLVRFLRLFPELSQFSLDFEYRDEQDRFSGVAAMLHIPKLEVLVLSMIDCRGEELTDLILYHRRTIREIRLNNINLTDGPQSWPSLVNDIRDQLSISYFSMDSCTAGYIDMHEERVEARSTQGLIAIIDTLSTKTNQ
ncbi:uncharacterized protein NECHADRAFT_88407 [Fusarium vanettenii 77-13-4]|uniref:F-box domain-containing protein n=1 Tax=Fusarium vanettenii (strain ATCC MYA-4622 / CBS 123669 / FGSC 9596 / NRRL 45880 / 77-13-4) TaxID=660122 RepID=C7ZMC1_FUSV7|nr:uncharacterized protein NECHADRAFT_88407 [Fusarium vanettenii 77-13-4]EEU34827.1 hypothetical protein NECHADRAFT_88407 [Fusarium vanettenii 77-13-4]